MKFTLEQKRKQYRIIYELVFKIPRIQVRDVTAIIGGSRNTVSKRMQEAFKLGYISGPHLRKRSHANFKEYMYFVNCEDPFELYLKYSEDENVVYLARMDGFSNLWVISKEKLDIKDVVVEGYRSDYHISFAPDHSWEKAIKIMQEKIENFNPEEYQPKGIIETHWDETIEWDEEDEILFRYFKYNMRNPLTPVMREYNISKSKIEQWFKNISKTCTILTSYFPETASGYDPVLYMFETDYEDFIIELFSELPTSCFFFKVSDKLFSRMYIDREFLGNLDSDMTDVNQLHIPMILRTLTKKGILKRRTRAVISHHCRKDL